MDVGSLYDRLEGNIAGKVSGFYFICTMNQTELDELIHWFSGRELPPGPCQLSKWESTTDLSKTVTAAIDHARRGNTTSIDLLGRLKAKLMGSGS